MSNSNRLFSKDTTLFFKGIGIILIFIHNFLHWQPGGFGLENESDFNPQNVHLFLNHISSLDWKVMITAIFSFLGHYGVLIFILFSAYGLSIQFQKRKPLYWQYLFHRLKKIYYLIAFAIIFAVGVNYLTGIGTKHILAKSILLVTSVTNFFDSYPYKLFSGPYWFFGLIIQLYLAFPFLFKLMERFKGKRFWIPFAVAYLLIVPVYFFSTQNQLNLFVNIFGNLPVIFLGIHMVQNEITRFKPLVLLVSLIVFIGSQFFEILFPFSFLAASILMIQGIGWLNDRLGKGVKKVILFTGSLSMILFIVNGPLRTFSFFRVEDFDVRFYRLFIFIPLLYLVSFLLFKLYNFGIKKLKI